MARKKISLKRREESLSRERIVEAAIALLDTNGEDGLTFRALSDSLASGPGAIYWHIANKGELLAAACDAVVARTLQAVRPTTPEKTIRAVAMELFDLIDERPWVGSSMMSLPGLSPIVRILEPVGQALSSLGVPAAQQWRATGTLMAYILGVSRQNAAQGQFARARNLNRGDFLDAVATAWNQLDADTYPFTRSIAGKIRSHDDREDFLAGIDLILAGIAAASQSHPKSQPRRRKQ